MNDLSASVIIPAYNCENTIALTIEAILAQTVPAHEIIIVDDGSTDMTLQVIQKFKNIRLVHQENAGPATARNKGAGLATGDILFFTDADCVPQENWIAKGLAGFKLYDVAVVSGSYDIANNDSLLARCVHQEILYRHHQLMPLFPRSFGSYNFAIKRDIFKQAGGFDEMYKRASGEDNDLSYRIHKAGHKIYFEKSMTVKHFHQDDPGRYLREQFRHGYWRAKIYIDHPQMASGDDYTFGKDIVEILLVVFLFAFSPVYSGRLSLLFFILLLAIELIYGVVILRKIREGMIFGAIMTARAFARTFGLGSGILTNFFGLIVKKDK